MNGIPMNAAPASLWTRWFPAFGWLRSYKAGWLRGDLAAGLTLAAFESVVLLIVAWFVFHRAEYEFAEYV